MVLACVLGMFAVGSFDKVGSGLSGILRSNILKAAGFDLPPD